MDLNWCRHADSGLPKPDVVIFLNVDVDKLATRRPDEEIYDRVEMQHKILTSFRLLFRDETNIKVNMVFVTNCRLSMVINPFRKFMKSASKLQCMQSRTRHCK